MKTRYFIFISYKGTSYHGWQVQPNSITIQKTLDDALSVILNEKIASIGAGRTDAGVHARYFCAHFDSEAPVLSSGDKLKFRLNKFLPEDISVNRIIRVKSDSHARFSALSRTYNYNISLVKDPFFSNSSWYVHNNPDISIMNEACKLLLSHSDFTSFSKLHSDTKTNICKIYFAHWEKENNRLVFSIKADRFLRNMVRAIVGTMIDVGSGKMNLQDFENVILAKDRCRAGRSAPARGLSLVDIDYPEDIFI